MQEILAGLSDGSRVLDLGSRYGSFRAPAGIQVAQLDLDPQPGGDFVQADARRLPFRDGTFDAVISNHSLEHIVEPERALAEIGRVLRRNGALYVAVPDASTLSDWLYRWLGRGGGHVNRFTSAVALAALIQRMTGLPHTSTRLLHSGYSFLNRRNGVPRRVWLLGGGFESHVRWFTYLARRTDAALGTRFSVYGWAMYFGWPRFLEAPAWTNVCIRCGSGVPAERLTTPEYVCAACGTVNRTTPDR